MLYTATLVLSLVGLVSSLVSVASAWSSNNALIWLVFYIPALWVLWILCVFFARLERISRLLATWLLIDLAVLFLLISFTISIENWVHSSGADAVILTIYFPVVMPIGLVGSLLLQTFNISGGELEAFFGSSLGKIFAVWTVFSVMAALQSYILIWLSCLLHKNNSGESPPF